MKTSKLNLLTLLFCLVIFLSGCVRYQVGINFDNQQHGTIVQHIKLGSQLTSFSELEGEKWLDSLETRAIKLQGKTKRLSPEEIVVTIPFNNSQELATKFNNFFNPTSQKIIESESTDAIDILQLASHMSVQSSNLILFERNYLDLTVDLRALGVLSNQGNLIVSPGSLIDLEFSLTTPGKAKSIHSPESNLFVQTLSNDDKLVWKLQPGEINHIQAVIWIPSFLAMGTVAIILLMILGFALKYRHFPGVAPVN